jgi:KDO2-lipid IV(A) lauroyltransferase
MATGAEIVMASIVRRPDGRHELTVAPPFPREIREAPDAVLRLTHMHVAWLEALVRRHPEHWLWLHRRWKTPPPALAAAA